MQNLPMPMLSKEVENQFAVDSLLLNLALMPEAARIIKAGQDIPETLKDELAHKMNAVVRKAPNIMAELIRRDDRIKELEAQVAAMLIAGPDSNEGE